MKQSVLGLILYISYLPIINAGPFGPSNFEECVLSKMKGQDRALIQTARAACRKDFPPEVLIDESRLKYTWCESEYESEFVCIEQVPPNVTITKIEAIFFEEKCDKKQQNNPSVTAIAKTPWFGSKYKFELPVGNRNCANYTFYGIEK